MANSTDVTGRHYPEGGQDTDPSYLHPEYKSTIKKSPKQPLVKLEHTVTELSGPVFEMHEANENDLTLQGDGMPLGERIDIHGRVLDEDGNAYIGALVEMWQANASGKYRHINDGRDAPLDDNVYGAGRCVTDDEGWFSFKSIRPGPYPVPAGWWRPAHLHFSVTGPSVVTRLITQMYFPGDPLLEDDPIYHSVVDKKARDALIGKFDLSFGEPSVSLGYRFDMVLRGRASI